jgi:hypothetical protein
VDNLTAALKLSSASSYSIVKYHLHLASKLEILFLSKGNSTNPGPVMRLHGRMVTLAASIMSALAFLLIASPASPDSSKILDLRDQMERKETHCSHTAFLPHFTCSWIAHRGYMVRECSSETADAREGKPSDHLTIFTYDDTGKAYEPLGICKDSKTLEAPAVVIEGNDWQNNYRKN